MSKEQIRKIRYSCVVFFLIYLVALIYFLLFSEGFYRELGYEDYKYNLQLGREILRAWNNREILGFGYVVLNLGGNFLGFVPMGMLLPAISRNLQKFWKTVILVFLFSGMVECIQLAYRVGCFDVDDLLLNTLGGAIGYLIFRLVYHKKIK